MAFEMRCRYKGKGRFRNPYYHTVIQTISKWLLNKGIQYFPQSFQAETKGFSAELHAGGPVLFRHVFL